MNVVAVQHQEKDLAGQDQEIGSAVVQGKEKTKTRKKEAHPRTEVPKGKTEEGPGPSQQHQRGG